MSYRVLTGPAIPFVHALPGGLGAEPEAPGTWKDIIFQLSQPFAQAASQRIAYGQTQPYYGSTLFSPMQSPYSYSPLGSFGGISPTMLLVGGAALLAVMMLGRK